MGSSSNANIPWIKLKTRRKYKDSPSEVQINMDGTIYIDGVIYDAENSPYNNLSIDIENHNRISSGEETEKIIESRKKSKRGEQIIIKDIEGPEHRESTTVKF